MQFVRKDLRAGRKNTHHRHDAHLIWRSGCVLTKETQGFLTAVAIVKGEAEDDLRPDGVQLELKGSHDAKVAAATADAPEEFAVFQLTGVDHTSFRCHHLDRNEVVAAQSILIAQPTQP